MMTDTIKPAAISILRDYAVVSDATVKLTCGQLDRKTYEAVSEVLERAGGKWNKKARVHLFDEDPTAILETIIHTGQLPPKNPFAFFETQQPVIARMIIRAGFQEIEQVLEPSAGNGAICDGVREVHPDAVIRAVEIDPKRANVLRSKGYAVHEMDFLKFHSLMLFDVILMNPPFAVADDPLAYIAHIEHAYTMLAPWGRLIAIAPSGFTFRSDKRCIGFRLLVEAQGGWDALPSDSFKNSGTSVNTVMLWLKK